LGDALVAGKKRVPRPATGKTALRTGAAAWCVLLNEELLALVFQWFQMFLHAENQ
jgi:hypothetical protein